ncbi:MAG TPA: sigma-54 dependent transcriptional regulator [candidate division Zixibacteria bacterium]|nr:sigma-54 dependent transcriptional regulator [candidate division Zixibacteria bacterium]
MTIRRRFDDNRAQIRPVSQSAMQDQPWITCYVTDMLLSYMRESLGCEEKIDYGALFRDVEGIETPADPKGFLADVRNWIPLSVLRELEAQCERISGKKDITYHAAKAYFTPGRKTLPSLFEIIVQVLADVRSALLFVNTWGASQTSYLRLQGFEKPGPDGGLYMLAEFDRGAEPAIGSINLLRGFCEGFPRVYPFIEEIECAEEISQLSIERIVSEFPEFAMTRRDDLIAVHRRGSDRPVIEARRVRLATEIVEPPRDFLELPPETAVVPPRNGRIEVLTPESPSPPGPDSPAARLAYRIVTPGILADGPLTYAFEAGRIYGAPYCRFRITVKERQTGRQEVSIDRLRRDVSKLLFEQLRQTKQAHTRMIRMSMERRQLALENIRLRREVQQEYSFAGLIAQSKRMQELFGQIRSVAETDVTVLIQGETGTGKELIARAIHYNGARRQKPFVAVNCGALSQTLLESELFGHERGAFTGAVGQRKGIFEAADGGTLFLDEIGEIPPSTQVKLLRVLQDGEFQRVGGSETLKVDVRVIAATNQNLPALVEKGAFRQDLYYRLNVFPLSVPPLRERLDDIPLLVSHFIAKAREPTRKSISDVTAAAMALLMSYDWPGNVRELENTVLRMIVSCKTDILDVSDIPSEIRGGDIGTAPASALLKGISRESREMVERRAIEEALRRTEGNVTQAAKLLGVSRATLQNKMKLYGLRQPKA